MDTKKIIVFQALKIFGGVVLFFFLMKLLNLEHITELRLFNVFFVLYGINGAIKLNIFKNKTNNYLSNLYLGFASSFLAVIILSISLTIYLFYIQPSFINTIEDLNMWGSNLSPPLIAFAILVEGLASSIILTFILMQYWKKHKVSLT